MFVLHSRPQHSQLEAPFTCSDQCTSQWSPIPAGVRNSGAGALSHNCHSLAGWFAGLWACLLSKPLSTLSGIACLALDPVPSCLPSWCPVNAKSKTHSSAWRASCQVMLAHTDYYCLWAGFARPDFARPLGMLQCLFQCPSWSSFGNFEALGYFYQVNYLYRSFAWLIQVVTILEVPQNPIIMCEIHI